MNKLILFLILILISGCIQTNFDYHIKHCGQQLKTEKPDTVSFIQEGNITKFTQIFNSYCSDKNKLYLDYKIKGKYITISETLYVKEAVKCICPMEIRGEIEGLSSGTYNIKFMLENKYTNQIQKLHEIDYIVD
jgi:hypothetical protein